MEIEAKQRQIEQRSGGGVRRSRKKRSNERRSSGEDKMRPRWRPRERGCAPLGGRHRDRPPLSQAVWKRETGSEAATDKPIGCRTPTLRRSTYLGLGLLVLQPIG